MNHSEVRTFYYSFFFSSSDFEFENKNIFYSFWLIFCPLDPDIDPGSQYVMNPTDQDPDPEHWF